MADESYDVMVIGTSQGGRFLPIDLAKAGRKVALVERGHLGGVCVNSGCTLTKTMVASARAAHQARRGAEYGVRTGPVSVDLAAVRERRRAICRTAGRGRSARRRSSSTPLRTNLLGQGKVGTRDRLVPYTVFIDPQLGRVGMTERQAAEQNRSVRVAKLPMSAVIRALETGETRGFMKAVIDADTQQILGAAVLGVEGGEIMTIIQVAMLGELPYTAMANAVFTHRLLAEGLNSLFMSLDAQ
nr:FAD-dependent oxidoreductase [Streptomyces antimycoticus]